MASTAVEGRQEQQETDQASLLAQRFVDNAKTAATAAAGQHPNKVLNMFCKESRVIDLLTDGGRAEHGMGGYKNMPCALEEHPRGPAVLKCLDSVRRKTVGSNKAKTGVLTPERAQALVKGSEWAHALAPDGRLFAGLEEGLQPRAGTDGEPAPGGALHLHPDTAAVVGPVFDKHDAPTLCNRECNAPLPHPQSPTQAQALNKVLNRAFENVHQQLYGQPLEAATNPAAASRRQKWIHETGWECLKHYHITAAKEELGYKKPSEGGECLWLAVAICLGEDVWPSGAHH